MADFTPLGAMVKAPQPMSMGDMVNLARNVQAYQQAEQINPLAVQKAQQEAETGAINLGLLQRQDMERKNIATYLTDHSRYMKNGNYDLETMARDLSKIAPNTYQDVMSKYTELQKNKSAADAAKINLTEDQMAVITSPFMVHAYSGAKDKQTYIDALDKVLSRHKDNSSMQELGNAIKGNLSILKDGDALPGQVIKGVQEMMKPSTFAPTTQVTPEGKTVTTQPSIGGAPPVVTMGVAGGLQQPGGPSAQQAPASVGGMQLPYPKRSGLQPYIPEPNEAADQASGVKYREGLVNRQTDISTSKRNLDEVISAATGLGPGKWYSSGVVGAARRKLSEMAGDPSYKQLSKDLANVQISNIQALGGSLDTVAGQQLMKMANGDETYPPDVLLNIARRAYSDLTNLDMQATGAEKFSQKYGDNNMKVYRQMWSKNADSKVFEAISIYNNVSDPEERKKEIDKLMGSDPQKRKEFAEKYRNIKKLTETGEL